MDDLLKQLQQAIKEGRISADQVHDATHATTAAMKAEQDLKDYRARTPSRLLQAFEYTGDEPVRDKQGHVHPALDRTSPVKFTRKPDGEIVIHTSSRFAHAILESQSLRQEHDSGALQFHVGAQKDNSEQGWHYRISIKAGAGHEKDLDRVYRSLKTLEGVEKLNGRFQEYGVTKAAPIEAKPENKAAPKPPAPNKQDAVAAESVVIARDETAQQRAPRPVTPQRQNMPAQEPQPAKPKAPTPAPVRENKVLAVKQAPKPATDFAPPASTADFDVMQVLNEKPAATKPVTSPEEQPKLTPASTETAQVLTTVGRRAETVNEQPFVTEPEPVAKQATTPHPAILAAERAKTETAQNRRSFFGKAAAWGAGVLGLGALATAAATYFAPGIPAPDREGADGEATKLLNQIASWKKEGKREGYVAEMVLNSLQATGSYDGNVTNEFVKLHGSDVNQATEAMRRLAQEYDQKVASARKGGRGDTATIAAQYFYQSVNKCVGESTNIECDYNRLASGSSAIVGQFTSKGR